MREDTSTPRARLALLLPAFEPDERFLPLLRALSAGTPVATGTPVPAEASVVFEAILVVDDGSSTQTAPLFAQAACLSRVRVLRHEANRGKGRALKTGIEELLRSCPNLQDILTADADGQHTPEDICRVADALAGGSERFVLGVRTREPIDNSTTPGRPDAKTPLRSALGNALTRFLFSLLHGTRVRDTQTGLRGFSRELLPELLRVPGERYEYEMAVLTHLCRQGVYPREVPIASVYLEQNRHSHFRPLLDSVRVYGALLRPLFVRRRVARLEARPSRVR